MAAAKTKTADIQIRLSSVEEMFSLAGNLFLQHFNEVSKRFQHIGMGQPKLHELRYRALERAGNLLCIAAFSGDLMVGYSVTFVTNHLHYADVTFAQNDALFVLPEYRKSSVGVKLIARTEQACKDLGAKFIAWHCGQGSPLESILDRRGYGVQEVWMSKEL